MGLPLVSVLLDVFPESPYLKYPHHELWYWYELKFLFAIDDDFAASEGNQSIG